VQEKWEAIYEFNLAHKPKNVLNGNKRIKYKNQETYDYATNKEPEIEKN